MTNLKKSKSFIGNALIMLAANSPTTPAAAVGTFLQGTIDMTPLAAEEIKEGLKVSQALLMDENKKNGADTELYDILSTIQTRLIAKGEQFGLDVERVLNMDSANVDEANRKLIQNDGGMTGDEVADQALRAQSLNGAGTEHHVS